MENIPFPVPEKLKKKESPPQSYAEKLKSSFERFRSLPDDPGPVLSEKEQFKLSKEAITPEGLKKWEEYKQRKHRTNTLSAPLLTIKIFLGKPDKEIFKKIPEEKRGEFLKKVAEAEEHINEAKKGLITDKEVNEVLEIIKDVESYLK